MDALEKQLASAQSAASRVQGLEQELAAQAAQLAQATAARQKLDGDLSKLKEQLKEASNAKPSSIPTEKAAAAAAAAAAQEQELVEMRSKLEHALATLALAEERAE
jgi:hypothetical protein